MPDITMCATRDCPIAPTCRRHEASGTKPSTWRQSWSAYQWQDASDAHGVICDYHWPVPLEDDRG